MREPLPPPAPPGPDELTPTYAEHAWLAAVVPADARRFRVADPALARTLRYAGAELVEDGAEVEIGRPEDLSGRAPVAIVTLNTGVPNVPSRVRQVVRRLAWSAEARARAELVRRQLRRRGYPHVRVIPWDVEQVLRLPGAPSAPHVRTSERFPRRALLVAGRAPMRATALDAATAAAAAASGDRSAATWPLLRAGSLLAIADATVLRVAIGPGRERIDRQAGVLAGLAAAIEDGPLAGVVPALLATGDAGLARWSVERRLPGAHAPERIPPGLLADCLGFLDALERCGDADGEPVTAAARAEALGRLVPGRASELAAIGARVDAATAPLGRVFGHGDFWSDNLLVRDGRLAGVVDWESAGPGRLPLLDLFQLTLVGRMGGDPYAWGRVVVEYLLPACRRGGDDVVRASLRRTGRDPGPEGLEALALAYWLDRATSQLTAHVGRLGDRAWMDSNVELVLAAVSAGAGGRR
ncbi:MAG TPA: phosphotransferase [Gaiellaceae bacterium]|nr:phosphotransferase [Gaiellaceae bacterium]